MFATVRDPTAGNPGDGDRGRLSGGRGLTTATGRIRVLLVDGHDVVRRGLVAFLYPFDDLEYVGETASAADALRLCEEVRPDVVLMDLVMPDMDGADATRALRERCPRVQVIALTSVHDEELARRALQAGAIGYLLKSFSAGERASAIRAAHAGQPTLSPEATQVLLHAAARTPAPAGDLTVRERAVLALLAKGLSNADIAARLALSLSTIKFHVSSILAKLGAASRTEAATIAIRRHLVK